MAKLLRRVLLGVLAGVLATAPGVYAQTHDESGATFGPLPSTRPLNPVNVSVDTVFTPVSPCRVCDTRFGNPDAGGCAKGLIFGTGIRGVAIAGLCGVPSGASAVSINITAVPATSSPGDLRAGPNPGGAPPSSVINYQFENVANAADIQIGTAGVNIFADGAPTDFIVDVMGYFREVTCQAGTVKALGQCWETGLRAALDVFDASNACRLVGLPERGRLGVGLQMRELNAQGILTLAAVPGEWTDSVYAIGTAFQAMTIASSGGFATQPTLDLRQFRCVFLPMP